MVLDVKQNKTVRDKNHNRITLNKIKSYIKNPVGNLDLSCTRLKKLPTELKYVDGFLDISYSDIKTIEHDIIIKSSLYCESSDLENISQKLIVFGDTWLLNTPLGKNKNKNKDYLKANYNLKGHILIDSDSVELF